MSKLVDFVKAVAADERIPLKNRTVLGGLVFYLITPIDLIPDFIPIIGWLDDAFVMIVVLDYIFNSTDTELILEHYPWSKDNFNKMRIYVQRLAWMVPAGLKRILFRQAVTLAIEKPPVKARRTAAEKIDSSSKG